MHVSVGSFRAAVSCHAHALSQTAYTRHVRESYANSNKKTTEIRGAPPWHVHVYSNAGGTTRSIHSVAKTATKDDLAKGAALLQDVAGLPPLHLWHCVCVECRVVGMGGTFTDVCMER